MKKLLFPVSAIALAVHVHSVGALEALDDSAMSSVSGQAGITIDLNPGDVSIDALDYTQDGVTARMSDIFINGSEGTSSKITLDVNADGDLLFRDELGARDFSVGGVGMVGSTGNSGDFFSLRGATSAYDPVTDYGLVDLKIGDDGNGNLKLDGSQVGLFFDGLHFGDDGLEWIIDDLAMAAVINYGRLVVGDGSLDFDFGDENNRGLSLVYDAKAIGLSSDPNLAVGDYGDINSAGYLLGDTFGSLRVDLDAYGTLSIAAGGKTGQGITFIPSLTLINDSVDRPAFKYTEDGYVILAKNFKGEFSTTSGFMLDFEEDESNNPYLALRYSDFQFAFSLDELVLGEENGSALGSFKGQVLFEDDIAAGHTNYLHFYPGGAIGNGVTQQGVTAKVGWNIVSADPVAVDGEDYSLPGSFAGKSAAESNTYFAMNDDGNWVYFNGFNGWGEGTVSLDLTSAPATPAADLYDNPYEYNPLTGQGSFDDNRGYDRDNKVGTYDGLRIDFVDLKGEYSFAGVTVGNDEDEAMSSPYMGGTELLLALEVFPSYSFTLNGNLTIAPGGRIDSDGIGGTQGLTLNGDLRVTEGNAAITVDEYGRGVWLTGVTYDLHMRGASLDVTEDGLTFNKGLTWSTIKVGDYNSSTGEIEGGIIFGAKDDGKNLGAFTLERLEDNTTISVASGGAGKVCIGGTGSNAVDCAASGGIRFEDRGEQGLTIKVKAKFAKAILPGEAGYASRDTRYDGKGNRFSWTQPNGTTLTLDNFSTSDGPQGGNDYGLNIDLNLDVARTAVRNNEDQLIGIDDSDGQLKPLSEFGGTIADNGPLGFAVLGRVHFKQLNIDGLKLSATPDSTPQTLISAITIQNADIQANLTATPIR